MVGKSNESYSLLIKTLHYFLLEFHSFNFLFQQSNFVGASFSEIIETSKSLTLPIAIYLNLIVAVLWSPSASCTGTGAVTTGTWAPQYSYYQVQVNSNGQCQGFGGFNNFGKRSADKVALLEQEVKRMELKQKVM